MSTFTYLAKEKTGSISKGSFEALNRAEAISLLAEPLLELNLRNNLEILNPQQKFPTKKSEYGAAAIYSY